MCLSGNAMPEDNPIFEVTPTNFAYGGEVIGRLPDGRAVFIPFVLPGEKARVRLIEQKRGYARAELLEVIEPAPERIDPVCVHFGECGGCHYQHMTYKDQLAAKREILADQLYRIGRMENPPIHGIVPSRLATHYRNHVQFHLDPQGKLGYHRARSEQVFAIQECHLPEQTLNQLWPQLEFEAIPGLERIGLRLGAGDDVQIILESSDLQAPEISVQDLPVSVVHLSPGGELVLAGSQAVVMEVLGRPFQISAGTFFQVNTHMAEAMVTHVLDGLTRLQALTPETLLVDVYCGAGLFSAFLAPQVGRLIGIEASHLAGEDFVVNLDSFDHVELYEAPAGMALPGLELQPDIVLVDPPRAGLDRDAIDGLLDLAPPIVVYVSCDPATLARDARRLTKGGYHLEQITPFDLFPQTYHIESVSFWMRSD
jgi:23S rRNA (uracil1939-C5)-methyltransferase